MNLHRFTGFASKSKLSNSGSGKKDPLRCWKKCWAIFLIGWNHMKTNLFKMWKWGKDVNLPCRMHNFESQFQFVCTKIGRFFFPEPDPFQYVHKFWRISPQNPISQMFFFPFSSSKSRHAWSYWIGREGVSKRGRCGQGVNKTHFGSWKKNDQWNLVLNRKMNWYDNLSSNLDSSHPDARRV